MTYSTLTNQVRTSSQSSSRNGTRVDTFLIHHQAGTNDDAVIAAMVSGSRGVSANYTISNEGRITSVVPEELRAWTSGSQYDGGKGAAWDRRSITVEIENQSAGGSWPISSAALNAAARLLKDLRTRYTIKNVLGHRDLWERYSASYPTFCPGPEAVAKIVALAGSTLAGSTTTPIIEGNPVKTIYKTTTGSNNAPLWALGDDEALDPLNSGWVETRDTNVVSGQWGPRYGSFIGISETQFNEYRAKFRAPRVNTPTGAAITDAQLDALATKVVAALKIPTAAQIAEAVNDDTAKRLTE